MSGQEFWFWIPWGIGVWGRLEHHKPLNYYNSPSGQSLPPLLLIITTCSFIRSPLARSEHRSFLSTLHPWRGALKPSAPAVFCAQYYFETIFPRIPKPVSDDLAGKLTAAGLPGKAIGNAGQGGADRRGVEDGSRRPASVKVRPCRCDVWYVYI